MASLASRDPAFIVSARTIAHDSKNPAVGLFRIVAWCRSNIGYTRESVETFQDPRLTLRTRSGDCDDHSCLVVAMALAVGIPARLATIAIEGHYPHHIVAALKVDGDLVVYDSTRTSSENRLQVDRLNRRAMTISLDGSHE